MNITVFGASGRIGQLVVDEALHRGHSITAYTHNRELPKRSGMTLVKGNITNREGVAKAIASADVVISCLSSWGAKGAHTLTAGMEGIIPAMETRKIKRLVSLTGADARTISDSLSFIHRLSHVVLYLIGHDVLADAEHHLKLLENSKLDWTVIRSPRMNKSNKPYSLTTKRPLPWSSVSRKGVAQCLVDMAEATEHFKQSPFIKNA